MSEPESADADTIGATPLDFARGLHAALPASDGDAEEDADGKVVEVAGEQRQPAGAAAAAAPAPEAIVEALGQGATAAAAVAAARANGAELRGNLDSLLRLLQSGNFSAGRCNKPSSPCLVVVPLRPPGSPPSVPPLRLSDASPAFAPTSWPATAAGSGGGSGGGSGATSADDVFSSLPWPPPESAAAPQQPMAVPASPPGTSPTSPATSPFGCACPHCNAPTVAGARFCWSCGGQLTSPAGAASGVSLGGVPAGGVGMPRLVKNRSPASPVIPLTVPGAVPGGWPSSPSRSFVGGSMSGLPPPDFAVAGGARTSRSNPTTPRGREAVSSLGGREAEQRRPSDETVATLRRPSDETVATLRRPSDETVASPRRPSDETVASPRRRPSNGDQPTTLTTAPSGNPPAAMAGATGAHDGALPPELDDVDDEDEGSRTLLKGSARPSRGYTHNDLPTGLLSHKGKSHRRNHSSGSSVGFSATILKEAREASGAPLPSPPSPRPPPLTSPRLAPLPSPPPHPLARHPPTTRSPPSPHPPALAGRRAPAQHASAQHGAPATRLHRPAAHGRLPSPASHSPLPPSPLAFHL